MYDFRFPSLECFLSIMFSFNLKKLLHRRIQQLYSRLFYSTRILTAKPTTSSPGPFISSENEDVQTRLAVLIFKKEIKGPEDEVAKPTNFRSTCMLILWIIIGTFDLHEQIVSTTRTSCLISLKIINYSINDFSWWEQSFIYRVGL